MPTSGFGTNRTLGLQRLRVTEQDRIAVVLRIIAGVPLLAIGVAHAVVPDAGMQPLVEAAGFPLPSLVAPLGVAGEIIAGLSLLLGAWARLGGLIAVPIMLGAIYAHLVIGVWPNGAENEPPLALPIAVALGAAYVVARGAGSLSLDRRSTNGGGDDQP